MVSESTIISRLHEDEEFCRAMSGAKPTWQQVGYFFIKGMLANEEMHEARDANNRKQEQ